MIADIINRLNNELPATVKLVAVSKFHPFEAIEDAYKAGQRIFAESRPQELVSKIKTLEAKRIAMGDPQYMSDIEWHFIGHLQTNKLKMVLPYVSLVQSVDSVRLLDAIESWASVHDKFVSVLLEPHVTAEESKQGFTPEEIFEVVQSAKDEKYPHVRFKGIMGMATFTDEQMVIRSDFAAIRSLFDTVRKNLGNHAADFKELSIGMSDDYPIAMEYGSTMVRIGSMIFGARNY